MNDLPDDSSKESEGNSPRKPKKRKRECKNHADTLPERFEKLWAFYREHIPDGRTAGNRQAAIRAWDNLKPDNALAEQIAKALAKQVSTAAWKKGTGVPHASTWLNNRGWEDDWGRDRNKDRPDFLPERFEKFWAFYQSSVPPGKNAGNRQQAIRAWDDLAPDSLLANTMAAALVRQVESKSWMTGDGVLSASFWLSNRGWEDSWGTAQIDDSPDYF